MIDVAEQGIQQYILYTSPDQFQTDLVRAVFETLSTPTTSLHLIACAKRGPYWEGGERGVVVYGILLVSPSLDAGDVDFEDVVEKIRPTRQGGERGEVGARGMWWLPIE